MRKKLVAKGRLGEVLLALTAGGTESSPVTHIVVRNLGFDLEQKII